MEVEATPAVGVSRRRIIKRPRLTRILDESGARIILLVAPAGYGKTTLAHEWLDSKRSAWYRGTPASADVAALAVGLASAAAEIVPGAGERMRQRLRATDRPDEDAQILAEMLAEDLAAWPEDAWLVIDDYQFAMESPACEDFIQALCLAPVLNVFITTRRRPRWATARRRLYGELEEIGSDLLAMSQEETTEVLEPAGVRESRLFAETGGWPAVIGLAAITGSFTLPSERIPQALYDYFAEELFQAAEPGIRWGLCQIAIPPSLDRDLSKRLFGSKTSELLLEQAVNLGILTPDRERFELHPLLRRFLETKLREFGRSSVGSVVKSVGTSLLERKSWDDAFFVADRFDDAELLTSLVTAAWEDLLHEGRVATISIWLDRADELHARAPIFDFVGAEIALRESAHSRAEKLALTAADALGSDHPLTSRAYFRAGQSAHFQAREETAFNYQRQARVTAKTEADFANALWGEFISGLELERADTPATLEELASLGSSSPTEGARIAAGRLFLALRLGSGLSASDLDVSSVIERVDDPLVRLSFIHAYGAALVFTAQYDRALTTINAQITELERYGLSFALPHSYLLKAAAYHGLRLFADATEALDAAHESAADEPYAAAMGKTIRALIRLSLNDVESALTFLEPHPHEEGLPAMRAERLACRAVALATNGQSSAAIDCANGAINTSTAIEPKILSSFAKGIVLLEKGRAEEAEEPLLETFALVRKSSNFNNLVRVYRIYPPIAKVLAAHDAVKAELVEVMIRADDVPLAKSLGLPLAVIKTDSRGDLSPRESEVYELVAQGLSNREIAKTLFISEATAKVHVRHILEKLGAKTRTEAVARGRRSKR
jgi:LuxR family transcriptional regulator, maltose regulon positive regulatory protein